MTFYVNKIVRFSILIICLLSTVTISAQKFAQKSNILYLLTTTPNIAFEYSIAHKWTIDLRASYNPWKWKNEMSLKHWMIQPALRFWTCTSFEGHFFEIHGTYAKYNIGNFPISNSWKERKYKGDMYGGGIGYGYHISLKGRWGIEFTLSLGYIYMKYEKYTCKDCKQSEGMYNRNYWGPTQVGVSLVYMVR